MVAAGGTVDHWARVARAVSGPREPSGGRLGVFRATRVEASECGYSAQSMAEDRPNRIPADPARAPRTDDQAEPVPRDPQSRPVAAPAPALGGDAAAESAAGAGTPLPFDAGILRHHLDNGMEVLVRRHPHPPDRCSLLLRIAAGSLHEEDDERGYAHFVEHLAFSGSEHFPPRSVIPTFERMGLEFGRDQNAFTTFDQTVYTLDVPQVDEATMSLSFRFLADVAGRLLLPEDAVEAERRVILEERRTGLGPGMRLMQQIWPQVLPGARVSERLPIGTEETLKAATVESLRAFYERWYRPDLMTLIVVGDIDAEAVIDQARRSFGSLVRPERALPADPPSGITFATSPRAAIAWDPEIRGCDLEISTIDEAFPPRTTVETFTQELCLGVAVQSLNYRFARLVSDGAAPFRSAAFSSSSFFRQAQWTGVSASCDPPRWREAMGRLAEVLRVADRFGFSAREVESILRQLRRNVEAAVEAESTMPSGALAGSLLEDISAQRRRMSARQQLDLLDELMPLISRERATEALRSAFSVERAAYVLFTPGAAAKAAPGNPAVETDALPCVGARTEGDTPDAAVEGAEAPLERFVPPDRTEIASLIESVLSESLVELPEEVRAEGLMPQVPDAAPALSIEVVEDLAITTARFANGVVLHHKFNDFQKDAVHVYIAVGGGVIDEEAHNRGITDLAVSGLNQPCTSRLTSADIRDLLLGNAFSISAEAVQDHVAVYVSATPRDLEVGLQLAHLLLTDPRMERSAFEHTILGLREQFEEDAHDAGVQVGRLVSELTTRDVRHRMLEASDLDRLALEPTETWLRQLMARGPVEVTVVGDLDWATTLSVAERYFGSLPPRAENFAAIRERQRLEIEPGPYRAQGRYESQEPVGFVLVGFRSTDLSEISACRHLRVAARVLTTRLNEEVRERQQLVYGIEAVNRPSEVHAGLGFFRAGAQCDPVASRRLFDAIDGLFRAMAEEGPTVEEVEIAVRQIDTQFRDEVQTPSYWISWLSALEARERRLDHLRSQREEYRRITPELVRETFARYYLDEGRHLEIEVLPIDVDVDGAGAAGD